MTGLTESRPDGKTRGRDLSGLVVGESRGENTSAGSVQRLSGLVEQAIETFRAARKIAPHAGVVKSVLRLFDELAKCDQEGALAEVREVIEGK